MSCPCGRPRRDSSRGRWRCYADQRVRGNTSPGVRPSPYRPARDTASSCRSEGLRIPDTTWREALWVRATRSSRYSDETIRHGFGGRGCVSLSCVHGVGRFESPREASLRTERGSWCRQCSSMESSSRRSRPPRGASPSSRDPPAGCSRVRRFLKLDTPDTESPGDFDEPGEIIEPRVGRRRVALSMRLAVEMVSRAWVRKTGSWKDGNNHE
jgi:hypothetical protein